jgi:hypothetical protein
VHYKHFSFRNFKGIEDMTIDLSGDVTTLIGLNESGKTTILEAIYCFSYGAEDLDMINPGMASLRVPEQWIPISRRANFNDNIAISALVTVGEDDKRAFRKHMKQQFDLTTTGIPDEIEIRESHTFENSRFVSTTRTWDMPFFGTKDRQRNPRLYNRGDLPEWIEAVSFWKARLPRIWYFPNFLFELPERFTLTESGTAVAEEKDKSHFYRSTFEQILTQLDYGANLETHVVARLHSDERADQRSLGSVLLDMGRAMTTTIFEGWDRIFGRPPAAQEVELQAQSDSDGDFLELRIKGPDGYYDLSERSLGFRWFFMFLLMTSFQPLDDEGPRSLFLLDEPASNLHSTAQAELLKSFENLVDRCYLVYTTHSHHLIDVRWLDAAYVVKNAALGSLDFADYVGRRMGANTSISATKYRQFVAEHPDQTSYFQPVLDLLDYRPSSLEPVPDVVLVEGKSDFYLLRYAIEVLGLSSEIHLAPGGGAGSLGPLISLHIGWGKSFIILLDGDDEGKKQQLRYVDRFGPVLAGRIVTLPALCADSAVREAEDLLSTETRDRMIKAVFASGQQRPRAKKAFTHSLLELYARREPVKIDDDSRDRIKGLLDELAGRLETQSP